MLLKQVCQVTLEPDHLSRPLTNLENYEFSHLKITKVILLQHETMTNLSFSSIPCFCYRLTVELEEGGYLLLGVQQKIMEEDDRKMPTF